MTIVFRGLPPHDLAPARSTSVQSLNGNVEVTLYVPDDWHPPSSIPIRIQMTPVVARSLAERLMTVAAEVESPV